MFVVSCKCTALARVMNHSIFINPIGTAIASKATSTAQQDAACLK